MEKKKILIIGSLNMDMDIQMERMPECGETVMGRSITYVPGGKGANQACAAGKMQGRVAMLGCIGDDSFGERQRENLAAAGVDVSYLSVEKKVPTGMAIIYIDDAGNNHIVVVPGANDRCSVDYIRKNRELLEEADYVVFQMEIPYDTIFYGIREAKRLGKTVILNPAPVPDDLPEDIWGKIDYLTPNEKELCRLSQVTGDRIEDYERGAWKLLEKGVGNVLVTLGSKGAIFMNRQEKYLVPARKVQAVDTTAAGDCFHGAFLTGISEGMTVKEAIWMANLASSIAVTRKGAQSSLPERTEVDTILTYIWEV